MHFACLVCEQVVVASLAAEACDSTQKSTRTTANAKTLTDPENASFGAPSAAISAVKHAKTPQTTPDDTQVSRCRVCDGIYHTPCLLKLDEGLGQGEAAHGAPFTCAKCRSEAQKQTGSELEAVNEEALPILVPALAFPYVRRPWKARNDGNLRIQSEISVDNEENDDGDMDESDDHGWSVLSTAVEVCTTCRQVQIAAEEKDSCLKCHSARLHRRCVLHHQAEHAAAKKKKVYRGTGRKRRRATGTLEWCAPCLLQNGKQAKQQMNGSIGMRTVVMLVRDEDKTDDQVQWWKDCCVCKGRFCLQEFCDPQETDSSLEEVLEHAPLQDESDIEWCCGHCAHEAAVVASQAGVAEADALVTVVICDGCEREFEMAALNPPLTEAPEGDWFCPACSDHGAPESSTVAKSTVTPELETVLICDGCNHEFDMASIYPPLSSIPAGDWFCGNCVSQANGSASGVGSSTAPLVPVTLLLCDFSTQDTPSRGQTRRQKTNAGPKRRRVNTQQAPPPTPAASPPVQESVVTVLLCDGCDHEFDPLALHPPVLQIPEASFKQVAALQIDCTVRAERLMVSCYVKLVVTCSS
ncbi:hypothetical protein PF008_g17478 [Phytophthora fragariae]|uniref:Zinc finger PHD-type domain-containing protein n=1 Tax=Phytophthora fragariae TaxID=53985 RepID=A0A6G0R850_9STRA|nr:hypothetical protein PF008_g17478 [Phytophthora fragariae]